MSRSIGTSSRSRQVLLWSPLAVIALGHLVARVGGASLGAWVWVPVVLGLWAMFAGLIAWGAGWGRIRHWLSSPRGPWGWSAAAVAVGLMPLPLFLLHWRLLSGWSVWLPWLAFALVNPLLEEGYWRGVLLEAGSRWPGWAVVLYSSTFFALNHPLTLGVGSLPNRHPVTVASTFFMGLIWAGAFRRTGSLRWAIVGHVLVDLLNLSVPAFLNLFVPSSFGGP